MNHKHNSFSRVDQINQPSLLSSPLLQGSETTPWFRIPNSGGGGGVVQERASLGVREATNLKKGGSSIQLTGGTMDFRSRNPGICPFHSFSEPAREKVMVVR